MFRKEKEKKEELAGVVTGLQKISNDIEVLKNRLAELESENRKLRSSLFTANSDYKRLESIAQREKENEANSTIKRIANYLLPVVDDLAQAKTMLLNSGIEEAHISPIEYILNSLDKAFEQMGLECFEPIGQDFDPHSCQLGGKIANDEYDDDKICKVVRKGYKIGDEIIRPAIVLCSQKNNTDSNESK
ncbi:MAG: nucleotide exchange factor GrpE [Caldisericia bacterium]